MQIGDTVYLKSGSPAMTVGQISPDGVYVDWFSGGTRFFGTFQPAALVTTDPSVQIAHDRAKAAAALADADPIPVKP